MKRSDAGYAALASDHVAVGLLLLLGSGGFLDRPAAAVGEAAEMGEEAAAAVGDGDEVGVGELLLIGERSAEERRNSGPLAAAPPLPDGDDGTTEPATDDVGIVSGAGAIVAEARDPRPRVCDGGLAGDGTAEGKADSTATAVDALGGVLGAEIGRRTASASDSVSCV